MILTIAPDGDVTCLYTEEIDLGAIGAQEITRASHVEPWQGGWGADLVPVDGPQLGPFPTRSAALVAETEWLEANRL